jgi:hypothetical protein
MSVEGIKNRPTQRLQEAGTVQWKPDQGNAGLFDSVKISG